MKLKFNEDDGSIFEQDFSKAQVKRMVQRTMQDFCIKKIPQFKTEVIQQARNHGDFTSYCAKVIITHSKTQRTRTLHIGYAFGSFVCEPYDNLDEFVK